jgi:hypothetical protein
MRGLFEPFGRRPDPLGDLQKRRNASGAFASGSDGGPGPGAAGIAVPGS